MIAWSSFIAFVSKDWGCTVQLVQRLSIFNRLQCITKRSALIAFQVKSSSVDTGNVQSRIADFVSRFEPKTVRTKKFAALIWSHKLRSAGARKMNFLFIYIQK